MGTLLRGRCAAASSRCALIATAALLAAATNAMAASQAPDPHAVRAHMIQRGLSLDAGGAGAPHVAPLVRPHSPRRFGPEQYVHGLGRAAYDPVNHVYRLRGPNGEVSETHGPDPVSAVNSAQVNLPTDTTYRPVCVGGSGHRIVLVYAYPQGSPNNYAQGVQFARELFNRANNKLVLESVRSSGFGRSASYKVQCSAGVAIVLGIETHAHPGDSDPRSPANVQQSILDYYNPSGADAVKFVTFMDSTPPGNFSGVAFAWLGDDPEAYSKDPAVNYNARFSRAAITYQPYWGTHTLMHEAGHTLGAVQQHWNFASTGAGHCVDGDDIMCYNDGGPTSGAYSSNACPDAQFSQPGTFPFDCGYNTYFKTVPGPAGSWLNTFWNVGGREDDFLSYNPPW